MEVSLVEALYVRIEVLTSVTTKTILNIIIVCVYNKLHRDKCNKTRKVSEAFQVWNKRKYDKAMKAKHAVEVDQKETRFNQEEL